MSIYRAATRLSIARYLNLVISFGGLVIFTRLLSQSNLGSYFLFVSVLEITGLVANLGIHGALKKRLSGSGDNPTIVGTALRIKTVALLLVLTGVYLFRETISDFIGAEVLIPLVAGVFANECREFCIDVLEGESQVSLTAPLHLLRQITWLGTSLIFIFTSDWQTLAVIWGAVVGHIVVIPAAWYLIDTPVGSFDCGHARSLFDYAKYNFMSHIGGKGFAWVDTIVIGALLGPTFVAAYEVALRLTSVVSTVAGTVATSLFPEISRLSTNGDYDEVTNVLGQSVTLPVILALPAFFGTLVIGEEMLIRFFGSEYGSTALVLNILMLFAVIKSFHLPIGSCLKAIDKPDLALRATLVAATLNIILNVLLIRELSLTGAAIATVLAYLINLLLHAWYLNRYVSLTLQYRRIIWSLAASMLMTSIIWAIGLFLPVTSVVHLLAFVATGITIYFLVLYQYDPIREQIETIIRESL